jgi:WD40 repeat protein/serine/threonine protein kinase
MGAADSFDGKSLEDDPTRAAAGANRCDHPTITAATSGETRLDASDSVGFLLQGDSRTAAQSSQRRGDYRKTDTGRSLTDPPTGDPSTDLTTDRPAPDAHRERAVPVIDGYEILGELGRGGMGIVYRARQVRLNRHCALKMILGGVYADAPAALRFLAEAEAVARLQHPNIVQIHNIGEADNLPFIELEYVDGGSLDRSLDGTPWHERRAAALIEALACGVAEAHRRGIVHRDLKPGNVLLAADGTPKITDFGLAKSLATDSGLTATDSIMGSPGYMAPEQAEGKTKQVGPPADVYALGAILYELLTGRPPFRGATVLETLELVKKIEPVSPSRLVPGLPRDIETIALKCLQKEPARRYDSASALAEDLRRFLDGEPIVARPVPPWERALKWARRRPAIATLVAAVLLLVASLLGLGIWSYAEINRSLTTAEKLAETEARANGEAQEQTKLANQRANDLAWEAYINRVNRAYREVQDDNVALAEDLLQGCPIELRGWEWHYVNRLCHPERLSLEVPAGSVYAIAYSPDGHLIATGTGGPYCAGRDGSKVALWDRQTGQRLLTLGGTERPIWSLAFSPDGTKLVVGSTNPQIEVRDVQTGEILWAKNVPRLPQAMGVAFNPDGQSLAVGFGLYASPYAFPIKLYKAATGQETDTFLGPRGGVNDLAIHPDGRHMAVAGKEIVEVWDVVAHTKVHELRGHPGWVYGVAFSPDGKWLATGGWGGTVKLWDAVTGAERSAILGHRAAVYHQPAFSPDSRSLATASGDRSVRLWEVPTGRPIGVFHGHTDFVEAVAFAPDGRELASAGDDGTLKLWDRRSSLPVVFTGQGEAVCGLWYRRDGSRVVSVPSPDQGQGPMMAWDPSTGELDPTLTGIAPDTLRDEYLPPSSYHSNGPAPELVTSPDAKLLARVIRVEQNPYESKTRSKSYSASTVEVRDVPNDRVLHTLIGHTAEVVCIAFSPDGRRIATASYDQTVKLWDTATGREMFTLRGHAGGVIALAFSPEGHRIVSGGLDNTARVWDATPLSVDTLQAQEASYQQKQEELKAPRERADLEHADAAGHAEGENNHLPKSHWELTAAALGKYLERVPDPSISYRHILSLVEAGNRAGVWRVCEDLLKRFGKTTDPAQANIVAWSCVLVPDAVADREAPIRLAENALVRWSEGEKSDVLNTLGAALYRAGRFEEAIRRLNEGVKTWGDERIPKGFAFLAMAQHRLGHQDDAKHWLDKLIASQVNDVPGSWNDVESRILRREAESLILGGRPAAPPATDPAPIKAAAPPDRAARPVPK